MEWISVKDQLPEAEKEVLLLTESGAIEGKLNEDQRFHKWDFITLFIHGCGCCSSDDDRVTHWMPLPELPE